MSYSRRRKLPWHQRPRAWFRGWLYHVLGREEEQEHLTDDHGNHIGQDLPPVEELCCVCGSADVGYHNYRDQAFCWPCADGDDRPVIQAVLLGDQTIILDGEPSPPYNPAWMPCWSRQDVLRPARSTISSPAGPGYLSAFASPFGAAGRIPPTPPPPARPAVWWRPRECGGRITLLAGA